MLAASETSKAVPAASNAPEASMWVLFFNRIIVLLFHEIIGAVLWNYNTCNFFRTTPQHQVPSLDHQEMCLTTSSGSPLIRARKALLLATNHQEMGLTTSPGSPLTRAKKALLLGKQNWSACAVYLLLLIMSELVWLNLYGLSCMALEPYYGC